MKQVQYTGVQNRVLIDVGSFSSGDVFDVNDDLALSLVASFPADYALVLDETVIDVEEATVVEAESLPSKSSSTSASSAKTSTDAKTSTSDIPSTPAS